MRAAIFCAKGLGDGLVSLVLSYNLHLNGYETFTFSDKLVSLQSWFPSLLIKNYPDQKDIEEIFSFFSKIFVSYSSDDPLIQNLIQLGKKKYKDKIFVLNPSYSRRFKKVPFYKDCFFSNNISVVENIYMFCSKILQLRAVTKKNGIVSPYKILKKKERIIIHPAGSKKGKRWPLKKFLEFAEKLKEIGFMPAFVVGEKERDLYKEIERKGFLLKSFSSIEKLATFVSSANYMVGNDSGVGHLCSCLGLSTLSITKSKRTSCLWRPGWEKNLLVYPSFFIPNIKFFRIRDRYWKNFVSLKKVFLHFLFLIQKFSLENFS